jgi:hypothetical protein
MLIAGIGPRRAIANHLRANVDAFERYSSIHTMVGINARIFDQHRLVVNEIREMFPRDVAKHLAHLRSIDTEQAYAHRAIEIEDRDHVAAVDFDHFTKQRRASDVSSRRTQKSTKKGERHKMPPQFLRAFCASLRH